MAMTTHYILYLFGKRKAKKNNGVKTGYYWSKWVGRLLLPLTAALPVIGLHAKKKVFKYKDDIPPSVPHSTRTI